MNTASWTWPGLFLLGAYHGANPAMGWLFAVALAMQEKSRRAVGRSLLPMALGHGLAVGGVILIATLVQVVLPLDYVKILTGLVLLAFGFLRLMRNRHPRWVGMRVGFGDLTLWSFLMASAHGAGFMVLPILLRTSMGNHGHHLAQPASTGAFGAVLVHMAGYIMVTGLIALLVYERLGLALLRKAWLNLDLVWAVALIATGCLTFLL